jgi:hypothetical protein
MKQAWQSPYEAYDAAAILAALPSITCRIQKLADKNFDLLKADPHHPSLHFKKVGKKKQLWSVRVGGQYRALSLDKPEGILRFWIGPLSTYNKLIS